MYEISHTAMAVEASNGSQREDKNAYNFTTKVNFCTINTGKCHHTVPIHSGAVGIFERLF